MTARGEQAVHVLAKSVYDELTAAGYDQREIVHLATALLGEVTSQLSARRRTADRGAAAAAER